MPGFRPLALANEYKAAGQAAKQAGQVCHVFEQAKGSAVQRVRLGYGMAKIRKRKAKRVQQAVM